MKHMPILSELPRLLRAFRLPVQRRKPWDPDNGKAILRAPKSTDDLGMQPTQNEVHAAEDVIYHLCCEDSLSLMAQKLGVSEQRIYDALIAVFQQHVEPVVPIGPWTDEKPSGPGAGREGAGDDYLLPLRARASTSSERYQKLVPSMGTAGERRECAGYEMPTVWH